MPSLRRALGLAAFSLVILALSSCGGSSGSRGSGQPPNFTSTPPTAAVQGTAYTYPIAATDPAGGTVSFALTTGPTGASVNGNTLSWTPAAAQSRIANSFTVTATTSEGGSATQSWSVSPAGTVTVNWVNTYWESGGPVQVPFSPSTSLSVSAIVPQPDGSLTVLKGSTQSPGVVTIDAVPAGYYWLNFGIALNPVVSQAYWTSTSTFDAGRDIAGAPVPVLATPTTTSLDFNLSGLDSVPVATPVNFNLGLQLGMPYFVDPANSPTLSVAYNAPGTIDWSQVKSAYLMQYEPFTLGPWSNLVLGPEAEATNLSLTNGATNSITQTLSASPQQSLAMNVLGSQWNSVFTNASPATPTKYVSGWSLVAEPNVTGIDADAGLGSLILAGSQIQTSGLGFTLQPFGACDALGFQLLPLSLPTGILTDQNLGSVTYGDPFSPSWTRSFNFCQEALVPVPLPNSSATVDFGLVASMRVEPSGSSIAPLLGPVQAPTINGGSLFSAATLTTSTPTLTWSAPSGATPIGYSVQVFVATTLPTGQVAYLRAAGYSTAKTSLTPIVLSGGNTYVFSITALVNGAAKIETGPFRSALPSGQATVVSAPITISAGATMPRVRGDARIVKQFSQPR